MSFDYNYKTNRSYIEKVMMDIKKNGIRNPSVGEEGNHRAAAFYLMNKELPYLEIIEK